MAETFETYLVQLNEKGFLLKNMYQEGNKSFRIAITHYSDFAPHHGKGKTALEALKDSQINPPIKLPKTRTRLTQPVERISLRRRKLVRRYK